ncbi:SixA phosphatase family protein [Henriciella marina]|uniref:Histidine phosphatase family protein n=1 Tax=Henriciella marina TaxID=453851 RepID=A0ABT4LXX2_9PROT|nr:histidine phosphatase family protein [Henriciella marina]MCZ4299226.1 histidine phosphatase family protein [Henriciella marina]
MKRLILLRHAKTELWNEGVSDRDRKLVARGHKDAQAIGNELKARGWVPDAALVSSARRTRETWRHLQEFFPACEAKLSDTLYLASVPTILDQVTLAAPKSSTLMVIGHNPGMQEAALSILREAGTNDEIAARKLGEKLPTGTAVLFESEEDEAFTPVHFKMMGWIRPKSLRAQI